jgi:hypothetical protein
VLRSSGPLIRHNALAETKERMAQVDHLLNVYLKQLSLGLLRFTFEARWIFPMIVLLLTASQIILLAIRALGH